MPSVTDFIRNNAKPLADLVRSRLKPLHDPGRSEVHPRIHRLLRRPKGPQGHLITAAIKALERQNDITFATSMGTGKTSMAIATAHCRAEGRPYAVLIVCPPHLVKKWEREIRTTVPDPAIIHVREWKQWLLISKAPRSMVVQPTYFITPISTARLGARWTPAMLTSKRLGVFSCPQCGITIFDAGGNAINLQWLKKQKRFCEACGSALWQYTGFHKEMASRIMKKSMKRWFDVMVYDEAHAAKSSHTQAGDALGHFIKASRKQILLTGTLIAGRSEDLRPTFFRFTPKRFLDRGIGWGDEMAFARDYGRVESVVNYDRSGKGKERISRKRQRVKAGIMPALYRDFVADRAIFLSLKEMGEELPALVETTVAVDMSPAMMSEYARMKMALVSKFSELLAENRIVAMRLLSSIAEILLTWPDDPVQKNVSYQDEAGQWHEIYTVKDMSHETLPKEKRLLEVLAREKSEGRQVWIYITRTAVAERILALLHANQFATGYLTTRVAPEDREDWIAEFGPGIDVCVSHVKLVETGLDLFSPPDAEKYRGSYNFCTLLHY